MKTALPLMLWMAVQLIFTQALYAQDDDWNENTRMFRIYVDNDFLNIRGQGTDDAYTGGNRLDFFTRNIMQTIFLLTGLCQKPAIVA